MEAYDPDRIQKIGNIMQSFLEFARPEDEVHLGLEGDPVAPAQYRGVERPIGVITAITGPPGERVVEITMKDSGVKAYHREYDTHPTRTFEFTDAGYRAVLERVKAEAEEQVQMEASADLQDTSYRSSETLHTSVADLQEKMNMMHSTFVKMASGFAQDMSTLAAQMQLSEPTFSGALVREMTAYRNANCDSVEAADLEARSAVSSMAAGRPRDTRVTFSQETDLSI
jgi:hypothetical protein